MKDGKKRSIKLFFLGALIGFSTSAIYLTVNHSLPNFIGDIILFPGWTVGMPLLDFLYDNYCQPAILPCRSLGDNSYLDRIAFFAATTMHLIFYGVGFVLGGLIKEKWENKSHNSK